MVKYLIARQISGKKIITNEGEDFGTVLDLNINEVTGKIEDIVVEPNPDKDLYKGLRREIDGEVLISYDSVLAVGDYIIVDKRKL